MKLMIENTEFMLENQGFFFYYHGNCTQRLFVLNDVIYIISWHKSYSISRGDGNSPMESTCKLLANSAIFLGISLVSSSRSGGDRPNIILGIGTFMGSDLAIIIPGFSNCKSFLLYAGVASGKPGKKIRQIETSQR